MGFLIAAGILTLLAVMPVGVSVRYDTAGFLLKLLLGPVSITLFPRQKKEKEKPKTAKKTEKTSKPTASKEMKTEKKGGSLSDFQGIITQALAFLGAFTRRLVVKQLELKVCLAGEDPCDLACNYGRSLAALGNLMPLLEKALFIKKRDVAVNCDFTAVQTTVYAHIDIVISIGRLLWIAIFYGIRILKEYMKLKNLRKGGNSL